MINYTEKGLGLHKAIHDDGHEMTQIDGVWVSSDDAAVQIIIDGFDTNYDFEKAEAMDEIDVLAGNCRSRFITTVQGQEMVYIEKEKEARAYFFDVNVNVPHLEAESIVVGLPIIDLANEVISIATLWKEQLSPAIEAIRMSSKRKIKLAGTQQNLSDIVIDARVSYDAVGA